jgi:hypothetical protein
MFKNQNAFYSLMMVQVLINNSKYFLLHFHVVCYSYKRNKSPQLIIIIYYNSMINTSAEKKSRANLDFNSADTITLTPKSGIAAVVVQQDSLLPHKASSRSHSQQKHDLE